jgi:hypothetical protein
MPSGTASVSSCGRGLVLNLSVQPCREVDDDGHDREESYEPDDRGRPSRSIRGFPVCGQEIQNLAVLNEPQREYDRCAATSTTLITRAAGG